MTFATTLRYLATLWVTVIAAISISIFVEKVAPVTEGDNFPAVTMAKIVKTEYVGPNLTRVWLESFKLRDCSFMDIEWRFGKPSPRLSVLVPVVFEEEPKVNYTGKLSLGPWLVGLSEEAIRQHSFATVDHQCHVFWPTRSAFYNGEESPTPND